MSKMEEKKIAEPIEYCIHESMANGQRGKCDVLFNLKYDNSQKIIGDGHVNMEIEEHCPSSRKCFNCLSDVELEAKKEEKKKMDDCPYAKLHKGKRYCGHPNVRQPTIDISGGRCVSITSCIKEHDDDRTKQTFCDQEVWENGMWVCKAPKAPHSDITHIKHNPKDRTRCGQDSGKLMNANCPYHPNYNSPEPSKQAEHPKVKPIEEQKAPCQFCITRNGELICSDNGYPALKGQCDRNKGSSCEQDAIEKQSKKKSEPVPTAAFFDRTEFDNETVKIKHPFSSTFEDTGISRKEWWSQSEKKEKIEFFNPEHEVKPMTATYYSKESQMSYRKNEVEPIMDGSIKAEEKRIENEIECAACGYKEAYTVKPNYCRQCGEQLKAKVPKEPFKLLKPELIEIPNEEEINNTKATDYIFATQLYHKNCLSCGDLKLKKGIYICMRYKYIIHNTSDLYKRCELWNNKKKVTCPNCNYLMKKQRRCPVCHESLQPKKSMNYDRIARIIIGLSFLVTTFFVIYKFGGF
jgi:ribosomal protein L37E